MSLLTTQQLLEHWQGHRRLSRRTITAFPADRLFTHTIGEMRPYGALALEMLSCLPTLRGVASGEWVWQAAFEHVTEKAALLKAWDDCDAQIAQIWTGITEARLEALEDDGFWLKIPTMNISKIQYWIDNEIHHRGQGYVYLRSLGIEPPPFWERN